MAACHAIAETIPAAGFLVLWRLRYTLRLRDLAEMFLEHDFEFTHEAIRDWKARFAPLMADQLRARRRGQAGRSW